MATRLYFDHIAAGSSSDTLEVSPSSWSAGWNKTAGAVNHLLYPSGGRKTLSTNWANPALSGTSGHFTASSRYVSPPIVTAATISGTVKGQMKWLEAATGDNLTAAIAIKVIQSDGTDRGVLLAVAASDDTSSTPPEMAITTPTNRAFRDSSENASITLSSLAVSVGDRIVVEVGARQASTSTATAWSPVIGSEYGSDLAEDDTATGNFDPWVEFSSNIVFAPFYYGSASTPADGAATTNTADPTAVTPPTGMIAGDLVCMIGQQRATGATLAISEAGGQTWTTETAAGTTTQTARLFWCIFNGTWGANPSVDFSATTCNSVQMHIFRPPSADFTWTINTAIATSTDATDPFAIASRNTVGLDPIVNLAGWFSADDNTYGSLSGTGWANIGSDQYRNTSGSDQSASYACNIQTTSGATNSVQKSQLTLGADTTATFIISFSCVDTREIYETGPAQQFNIATTTDTGTVSSAITVPTGTDFITIGVVIVGGSADLITLTFTKGGTDTAMDGVVRVPSGTGYQATLNWLKAPDTGASKSLKWDRHGGGLDQTNIIYSIKFWKNVDQTTPVRDSDADNGSGLPFTTPTMTAQSGDKALGFAGWFHSAESTADTWSNLVTLQQLAWNGQVADGAWGVGLPTGNVAVELTTGTGVEDGGLCAIIMVKVSSGATTQKALNVSLGETVSMAGRPGKTFKPTMAELVSIFRQTGHRVPIVQSQSVAAIKSIGRQPFVVTIGQAVTLSQAQNKLFQISQGQNILLRRSANKLVTVTQAQAVTLFRSISHLVSVTTAQAVSVLKSVGRRVLVSMGQTVTVSPIRSFQRTISVVQAQVVTVRRSSQKLIALVQGQAVTVLRLASRLVSVSSGQTVTVFRSVGHRVVVAMGQAVTVTATFVAGAGQAFQQAVNVVQAQSLLLFRSTGKLVLVGVGESVSLRRSSGHATVVGQPQSVSLIKQVGRRILMTMAQAVTTFQRSRREKTLNVTQAQTVTLRRSFGEFVSVIQGQTVTLRASIAKIIRVTQAQSIVISNGTQQTFQKALTVTQAQVVTLRRSVSKRVTVLTAQVVTVFRHLTIIIRVSTAQAVIVLRSVVHRVVVTMGQTITRTAVRAKLKIVNVSQAQTVALRRSMSKVVLILTAQAVTMLRRQAVIIRVSTEQSIAVVKAVSKRIVLVTQAQVVSVFTSVGAQVRTVVVSLSTGQTVSVVKAVGKSFSIPFTMLVSVFTSFAGRVRRASMSRGVFSYSRSNQSNYNRSNSASGTRNNSAD